jgi:hypothetical protein
MIHAIVKAIYREKEEIKREKVVTQDTSQLSSGI